MGLDETRLAIVLPTFNNAGTLGDIIAGAARSGLPIFVVDDGCTDNTAKILGEFAGRVEIIHHARNRGKAAALRSGFAAAQAAGFTHAITLDTDGQLDPGQIPRFVERALANPQALVIGVRDENTSDYPNCSRVGRRVSNFLVMLETGMRIADTQCGFRAYPLEFIAAVPCFSGRFGFETEIITRAGWAGCPIEEIPVSCIYTMPAGRVSHFCPWCDSFRGAWMHIRLLSRAFLPLRHRQWPVQHAEPKTTWLDWLSPARAWRELREEREGRWRIALSIGIGVWIANMPIYPCQTIVSLYTARRLHLNPIATILGNQASMPPLSFLLIAAGIAVGHFLLHGKPLMIAWNQIPTFHLWQLAGTFALDWAVGGVIFGLVLGAAVFGLLLVIFACIPAKRRGKIPSSMSLPAALPQASQGG